MPSDGAPDRTAFRRLHPSSLLFSIGAQAKSLLLPGLVVLYFAARGDRFQLWLMLLFVPAAAAAVIRYWSYRYRFDAGEMIIREGIVFRNERHVPYARIQNVDLVQNPVHRWLRVAEVRLETAGGQKPEAVLRVLSLDAVEHLRARVFAGHESRSSEPSAGAEATATPAPSPPRPLHGLDRRDLLLFGLISNKGMVVVAAAVGVLWQLDVADRWMSSISRESLAGYERLLPRGNPLTVALLVLIALVVLVAFMRLLSVVWAFAKFHGFRLALRGDDLRAEYGLLPHVSKTIPRRRIQRLAISEGFLHRRCGRVAVQVETAGSAGEEEGPSADRLWLAPLLPRGGLTSLVSEVLPGIDLDTVRWEPISRRARRRVFRRLVYWAVPVTAGAVALLGPWGLVPSFLLLPLAWLHASLWVRHTGYAVAPQAVLFRSGWWTRRASVVRFGKIQSLERVESPFDRRHRMASLRVDTAGAARIGHSVDIPYLDDRVATRLMEQLYREACRTTFRW
jgi:putative membrane protein